MKKAPFKEVIVVVVVVVVVACRVSAHVVMVSVILVALWFGCHLGVVRIVATVLEDEEMPKEKRLNMLIRLLQLTIDRKTAKRPGCSDKQTCSVLWRSLPGHSLET